MNRPHSHTHYEASELGCAVPEVEENVASTWTSPLSYWERCTDAPPAEAGADAR